MTNAVSPLVNLENLEEKREENKEKTVLVQVGGKFFLCETTVTL